MWEVGCGMQDAESRMEDAGCRMQDGGYRVQDAGCRLQDAKGAGCMVQGEQIRSWNVRC